MGCLKFTHCKSIVKIFLPAFLLLIAREVSAQSAQLDTTFHSGTGANAGINELIIHPDGRVLVAGMFTTFNGSPAGRIIRLMPDGDMDSTWITSAGGADHDIRGMALQPDGKIIIGGIFGFYNGATATRLVRLNSVGNTDPTFVVGAGPNNEVQGITVSANRAVIRGFFNNYQGIPVPNFAVLQMNGSLDPAFILPSETFLFVNDFHLLSNNYLYLGGNFTTYNGNTVNRIVRLHPNGSIDTTFHTGTGLNGMVRRLLVQNNGDILVAGTFNTYNGSPVSRLIRLHPNGDRDTSFNANVPALATLDALAIDTAGRVYMSGSDGGNLFLKRLLPDGSEDLGFNTGLGFNGNITQLAHQSSGKLLVTGFFTNYQNQVAGRVARMFPQMPIASTKNIIAEDHLTIYPNPATDRFYLRINNAGYSDINIKVRDIQGRVIYEHQYQTERNISIISAEWVSGIYFLEVINNKGERSVLRLMKQ